MGEKVIVASRPVVVTLVICGEGKKDGSGLLELKTTRNPAAPQTPVVPSKSALCCPLQNALLAPKGRLGFKSPLRGTSPSYKSCTAHHPLLAQPGAREGRESGLREVRGRETGSL